MKRLLILPVLLLTLLVGNPAFSADFQKGLTAARSGDFATALREWRPLAEHGHADAQYNLGLMYETGQGVPKIPKRAVHWYLKSAKSGSARVLNHLGTMYTLGKGVSTDIVEGYMYFSIAGEMGDGDGIKGRNVWAKVLTSSQRAEAHRRVRQWWLNHGKK